jgi:3-hydroxyisobutyrate dehydrogenase-like beta-hydroxyacid dehydrogenase
MNTVGVIGVGAMGRALVVRLLDAGFGVVAYDISTDALDTARSLGASVASSPSDLGDSSDVILSSLPDAGDVERAYFGHRGAVLGTESGRVLLELSTIGRGPFLDLAERLDQAGHKIVDGAIIGDPLRTLDGSATLLLGGSQQSQDALVPIVDALSRNVIKTGELGSAKTVKLVSNLVVTTSVAVLCEALYLGTQGGVDIEILRDSLASGWARLPALDAMPSLQGCPEDDHSASGGYSVDQMRGDLRAILSTAEDLGVTLEVGSAVESVFSVAHDEGLGAEAMWAAFWALRRNAERAD